MAVWLTTPVDEQPEIMLRNWRIVDIETKGPNQESKTTSHIVGYNVEDREGRVSSAIVEWDAGRQIGRTMSGRVYGCIGAAGHDGDANYVLNRYLTIIGGTLV